MKKIFITLFSVFLLVNLYAQTESPNATIAKFEFKAKQVISPSPNAAELGKYGNVPVSLFTGTPTISIPLGGLKGNSLSLPVSLSYNASGFKPQDIATWTGSGWSLNAGGVITRAVIGNPDLDRNYYNAVSPLNPPNNSDMFVFYNFIDDVNEGRVETQPDEYFYNFNGHSGKFLINPDKSVIKKKRDMLQIIPDLNAGSSSFTIIDEEGNTYYFTEEEKATSITDDGGPLNNYNYTSSWYLTRITSADGNEEIKLSYETSSGQQELYSNPFQNQSWNYDLVAEYQTNCPSGYLGEVNTNFSSPPTSRTYLKFLSRISLNRNASLIQSINLAAATGRQDTWSTEDRQLNQISQYSMSGTDSTLTKKFDLSYSYFVNGSNKRLRLDAVQEMAVDGSAVVKPPYLFTYHDAANSLPARFTPSLDHWGFYNASGNTTLVPNQTVFGHTSNPSDTRKTFGGGANREPGLSGARYTILNKIQYPTGGYTVFDYELNKASFYLDGDTVTRDVGGLRIREISDYSISGILATKKQYQYVTADGDPSGVIGNIPAYLTQSTYSEFNFTSGTTGDPCSITGNKTHYIWTISANSIFGLGSVGGSHIGYSMVRELQLDNSNRSLGSTVYRYDIGYSGEHDDDIRNGELLSQTVYNSAGKLLKETSNTYQRDFLGTIYAYYPKPQGNLISNKKYCYDGISYNSYPGYVTMPSNCVQTRLIPTLFLLNSFAMRSQDSKLTSTTEKIYDSASDNYRSTTTSYSYGNSIHTYPTLIKYTTTGNTELVTLKKYTGDFDIVGTAADAATKALRQMKNMNMLGKEVEVLQYRQNADGSNKRYLSGTLNTYVFPVNGMPGAVFGLETAVPLTSVQPSAVDAGNNFIYDPAYKKMGSFVYENGNLVEQSKTDGPVSSYIWDYNTLYPVASVSNASTKFIAYTGFEAEGNGGWELQNISRVSATAFTGRWFGVLSDGGRIYRSFFSGQALLPSPMPLNLSYYASSSAVVTINGTTVVPVSAQGVSSNGWTLYSYVLPIGTSQIEIKSSTPINIDDVQLYPKDAQMQAVSYSPSGTMLGVISASSDVLRYKYDGLDRLIAVRDYNNDIKQHYSYSYGPGTPAVAPVPVIYFSSAIEQGFVKQGCTSGAPTTVVYKIPSGKYSAATQAEADALAAQEVAANGQNYANANGLCLFYNTEQSRKFFKNNCGPEQGPGQPLRYVVQAGKYGAVSQVGADALATDDINANGQTWVNENGSCTCGGEGQKIVNGNCETGVKIYTSSTATQSGQFSCVYWYQFSDGSHSTSYTVYSATPCLNN